MQSARADVLGPFVHDGREVGDAANRVVGKREVDPLGVHQRGVLLDQRAARLGENADELLFAERMELDPDRKASLQFRNEVRRFRHMERAGRDEEDVVGAHHPVFRVHSRALDNRQNVPLDPLAADIGPVTAFTSGDLVDFVDKDDAGLLHALDRRAGDAVHVDELLLFFLCQVFERLGHLQAARFRFPLKQARQHVLEVDVDLFNRGAGDDLEGRERLLSYLEIDHAVVEASGAELLAEALAREMLLLTRRRRVVVGPGGTSRRQQHIEEPLFRILSCLDAHFLEALPAHHVDAELDEVADHRFDVAADVPHFGELRGLHLHEGRLGQAREAPRDFGFADTGRPDHQDVFRCDFLGKLRRQLLTPHAIAESDCHGALGGGLADHVLVELGDDLPRC